ncbi:MAG TPA: hypothetical protein VME66_15810 [Candidatus Acidoferrales bacterium]|nr:hypothetical protein [Candidatus Acidoferrales bacterium]
MAYIEYLRARRFLRNYALAHAAFVLLAVCLLLTSLRDVVPQMWPSLTLGALFVGASFFCSVGMTFLGASLGEARRNEDVIWTQPASRVRIALAYFGVDVVVAVLAYSISVLTEICALRVFGVSFAAIWRPHFLLSLLLGINVSLIFYALSQLVTVRYRGKGKLAPQLWTYSGLLTQPLLNTTGPPIVRELVGYLNVLNPLAYLGRTVVRTGYVLYGVGGPGFLDWNLQLRTLVTGLFVVCIAACAVAVWQRSDA